MKKFIYLIVLALILSLVLTGCLLSNVGQVPTSEQSGIAYLTKGSPGVPDVFTLYAGQTIPVGTVKVWNDGVNLYVKYETTGGWKMTETHLAVVTNPGDFPITKKGNPKVGLFPYSEENIFTDIWEKTIELAELGVLWTTWDDPLYIAAHAVVLNETATGLGDNLVANGGFELPDLNLLDPPKTWAVFDIGTTGLEWTVEPTTPPWDPQPEGLELQRIWTPHSGDQYAELDAYDPVRIYQELLTTSTKGSYTLTYAWSPRPGVPVNEIEVQWNGAPIATHSTSVSSSILTWTVETHTGLVPNESGTTRLEFVETGPHDQYGMFLDSVSVVQEDTESAWADGQRFTPKGNWATYSTYFLQGVKVALIPCPYNYPGPNYPPGEVFVIFYNSLGTGYNFEMVVSLIGVEPNTEYDIHLSVTDAGGWSPNKVGTIESDGSGNYIFYMSGLLAPGSHVLGVVITLKDSGSDIYETLGVHPPYASDPVMTFY
jgi:hypothetical protein